jgi:hypothetical protein
VVIRPGRQPAGRPPAGREAAETRTQLPDAPATASEPVVPPLPAPGLPPPAVTRDEVDLLIRRAGLTLNAGQKADLAVSYQSLVALAAKLPRARPLTDEPAFVFHLAQAAPATPLAEAQPRAARPAAARREAAGKAPEKAPAKPAGKAAGKAPSKPAAKAPRKAGAATAVAARAARPATRPAAPKLAKARPKPPAKPARRR